MYLRSREEHKCYLSILLHTLKDKQLYAKLKKCQFCLDGAYFLRHVVTMDGISVDPKKVGVITNWRRPGPMIEI